MAEKVLDTWSPLAFAQSLDIDAERRPQGAPTYLDIVDARRLQAYTILAAYATNTRRDLLPLSSQVRDVTNLDGMMVVSKRPADSYREYGDAALLIDTARALVLGETQRAEVIFELPEPEEREDDADGEAQQDPGLTPQQQDLQDWVQDWEKRENLPQKLNDGESDTQEFGDGIYVVAPSEKAGRPKVRVYDPAMYFPDTERRLEGWDDEDYPSRVHLLWEWEDAERVTWVRRTTWEIRALDAPVDAPWSSKPREFTCWFRIMDYRRDRIQQRSNVYSEEMSSSGKVVSDWEDLRIDFVPVVHVANAGGEWGTSILSNVAQILDDVQNTDTDLAQASQAAAPHFQTVGAPASGMSLVPNSQLGLPEGASGGWVDTSKNLDALLKFGQALFDRLYMNSRLTQALAGRLQPDKVPSGIALTLGFHPARNLMNDMRRVRDEKFPLIVKFAIRMAQEYGWLAYKGETPEIQVSLGTSLPGDVAMAVETVTKLKDAHLVSTETAVRYLIDAGMPIDDAEAEVERIKNENFDAAVKLVDATGSVQAALEFLGLQAQQGTPIPTLTGAEPPQV